MDQQQIDRLGASIVATADTTPRIRFTPAIALPGVCARVHLPLPPNFLHTTTGGQVPVGELHPGDVTMLGLAMGRHLRQHWHTKMAQRGKLAPIEAAQIPLPQAIHPALAENVTRTVHGDDWHLQTPEQRMAAFALVDRTLTAFLEELTRG